MAKTTEIARENKLYSVALLAEPDAAMRTLCRALGIGEDTNALAADHMVDYRAWARLDTTGRMFAIANWLNAECAAIAAFNADPANYVMADDPLHTVGTRD